MYKRQYFWKPWQKIVCLYICWNQTCFEKPLFYKEWRPLDYVQDLVAVAIGWNPGLFHGHSFLIEVGCHRWPGKEKVKYILLCFTFIFMQLRSTRNSQQPWQSCSVLTPAPDIKPHQSWVEQQSRCRAQTSKKKVLSSFSVLLMAAK